MTTLETTFDPKPVRLSGRWARLVLISMDHAADLYAAGAEPVIWQHMPRKAFGSIEEKREWCDEMVGLVDAGEAVIFAIIDVATGKVCGSTRFLDIRPEDRGLEIGYTWLGVDFQRTGINTECKYLLLSHAFESLSAARVQFKTDLLNEPSQRAIERIGGVREGVLRRHMRVQDDRLRDSVYYSILDSEWPAVKARLESMMDR